MSNQTATSLEYSWADHERLRAQMHRAMREFGKDAGEALRWAAWTLASTLGESTRVAPKRRPIKKAKPRNDYEAALYDKTAVNKAWDAEAYQGGKRHDFTIFATSWAEARKMPAAQIKMSGLAKAAWMFNIRKLGSGGSMGFATAKAQQKASEKSRVEKQLTGNDPFIVLSSRLPYATDALIGGESGAAGAVSRAARMLAHQIDAKLAKRLKAA